MKKSTKKEDLRYLKRSKNLKHRRYNIETEYIDGVRDQDGNEVMRPLTREEKEFLNKFYKETVNAAPKDFYPDDKDRKYIYEENNARNRDIYTKAKATGKLYVVDPSDLDKVSREDIFENAIEHFYKFEHANVFENRKKKRDDD